MKFIGFKSDTTNFSVRPDQVTHLESKGDAETVIYFVGGHFITVLEEPEDVVGKLRAF
jgi:hypothetical protein